MKKAGFLASVLIVGTGLYAQSLPISIDSKFDDWTDKAAEWLDATNDGDDMDFLRMQVANDENHLFIKLELSEEINLIEDHKLTLYLDTDQNVATGNFFNGIGADVEVRFGEKEVFYELPSGMGYMSLNDFLFRSQPSVTSSVFEMAFDLQAVSNAGFDLFTSDGVKLVWKDEAGPFGDDMPNSGSVFTYQFDTTATPPLVPIELIKEESKSIRLLSWNTKNNGLDDIDRKPYFEKVLGVLQPDIVTFNECWDINEFQVASLMNAAVPMGNFQNWNTVKLDQGNITASRFSILDNWVILPGQRLTASLIDIPEDISPNDLLVINAHFRCCENDYDRQREADAFVQFILDAKSGSGEIDLPEGTPFVLSGDLNLVGDRQQLTTLLTGQIINTTQFGTGGSLDWDDSDLFDVISRHTDDHMAYTWQNDFSDFPPSRIDFHIVSNSVSEIDKTFTLNTATMPPERLVQYGLGANDTKTASDHLPKILDLILPMPTPVAENEGKMKLQVYPNPTSNFCEIKFTTTTLGKASFSLKNITGKELKKWDNYYSIGTHQFQIDLTAMPAGVYFLEMKKPSISTCRKLIKK